MQYFHSNNNNIAEADTGERIIKISFVGDDETTLSGTNSGVRTQYGYVDETSDDYMHIKLETAITASQLEGHEDCADLTPSIGVVASCLGGLT